ncbi:hypothetical protein CYMTET_39745 [Cymbomonas tetramitiformis]|uniref:DNA methylase N-4/N-6 domain-containing protein n=1 Tax=Cymbomonas tetramitiformis TaxID=36881 RepID=A0AAE0F3N6_9CHLO|nr:hypothetical protein CYMTET_39745 [Cymbomonas tetramitiformis]
MHRVQTGWKEESKEDKQAAVEEAQEAAEEEHEEGGEEGQFKQLPSNWPEDQSCWKQRQNEILQAKTFIEACEKTMGSLMSTTPSVESSYVVPGESTVQMDEDGAQDAEEEQLEKVEICQRPCFTWNGPWDPSRVDPRAQQYIAFTDGEASCDRLGIRFGFVEEDKPHSLRSFFSKNPKETLQPGHHVTRLFVDVPDGTPKDVKKVDVAGVNGETMFFVLGTLEEVMKVQKEAEQFGFKGYTNLPDRKAIWDAARENLFNLLHNLEGNENMTTNDPELQHREVQFGDPKCKKEGKTLVKGEKNADLMKLLANRYTFQPGRLIFDPFMGTGSTGVGALRAGRPFFGIEVQRASFFGAVHNIAKALAVIANLKEEEWDEEVYKTLIDTYFEKPTAEALVKVKDVKEKKKQDEDTVAEDEALGEAKEEMEVEELGASHEDEGEAGSEEGSYGEDEDDEEGEKAEGEDEDDEEGEEAEDEDVDGSEEEEDEE